MSKDTPRNDSGTSVSKRVIKARKNGNRGSLLEETPDWYPSRDVARLGPLSSRRPYLRLLKKIAAKHQPLATLALDETMMSTEFSHHDLQLWLSAAVEAAQTGGKILQDWIGKFSVREKSRSNLVTEADEASQAAIVESLKKHCPTHGFLGEENLNDRTPGTEAFWIIDPLDGTTNYVHGFPYYCVSIALSVGGRIVVGVVHDPTRNETFSAILGQGAFRNGQPIQTSGETEMKSAMAIASLPVATDPENPAVRRFLKALTQLQTVQRTGSAALNLAYVACGRIDAFWSSSLYAWDVAAGALLVSEAGGSVTTLAGDKFDVFVPSLLAASTATLRQELVTAFR